MLISGDWPVYSDIKAPRKVPCYHGFYFQQTDRFSEWRWKKIPSGLRKGKVAFLKYNLVSLESSIKDTAIKGEYFTRVYLTWRRETSSMASRSCGKHTTSETLMNTFVSLNNVRIHWMTINLQALVASFIVILQMFLLSIVSLVGLTTGSFISI